MYKRRVSKRQGPKEKQSWKEHSLKMAAFANFLCLILIIIQRVLIANKIYDEANGFVNLSLLILLSIAMITILPLKHAEVNLIKTRIQKEQIKNIGKVLHVSIVTSGLVSGIISVLLFFFSTKLSILFFGNASASMCFQYMSLFLLISGVSAALMGYFEGNGKKEQILFTKIIYVLFFILFSVIFSDRLMKYGAEVAVFLHSDHYKNSYAATGAGFGILLASFIDLLTLFICFLLMRSSLRYDIRNDKTKSRESNISIFQLLMKSAFSEFVKLLLFVLPFVLSILFYCIVQKRTGEICISEMMGIFFGKFVTFFMLPVALSLLVSHKIPEYLWQAYHEKDIVKVRAICSGEMKLQAGFTAYFIGLYLCLAKPLCELLFHYGDVKLTASLLMKSVFVLFFSSLAITTFRLLIGIKRISQAFLCLVLAAVVQLIVAAVCEFALNLGLTGILISMLSFSVMLLFLCLHFLRRYIKYHQEWFKSIVIPTAVAIIISLMGRLINIIFDSPLGIHFSVILAVVVVTLLYGYLFFKVFRVKKKELQYLPGGNLLLSIITFFRL